MSSSIQDVSVSIRNSTETRDRVAAMAIKFKVLSRMSLPADEMNLRLGNLFKDTDEISGTAPRISYPA